MNEKICATAVLLYPDDEKYFKKILEGIPEELINERKKHIKKFLIKYGL